MVAKPQMAAIRERVSSDMKNGANPPGSVKCSSYGYSWPFELDWHYY